MLWSDLEIAMAFSCMVSIDRKAFEAGEVMVHTLSLKIEFDPAGQVLHTSSLL
jgi:hypothetical protein